MSKRKTFSIILIALLLLIIAAPLIAFYSFKSKISQFTEEAIVSALKPAANLKLEEFSVSPFGVSSKKASFFIPKAFLQLDFNDSSLSPNIFSLFKLRPTFDLNTALFDSPIKGQASYHIPSGEILGSLRLDGLKFASLPQLALLGLANGDFSFNLEKLALQSETIKTLNGTISLKDIVSTREFNANIKLPNGARQSLVIPPIQSLNVSSSFELNESQFNLSRGVVDSDLGKADFNGTASFDSKSKRFSNVDFVLNADMSAKGMQYFGYLLPEISNNIINSSQNKFIMQIKGFPPHLIYSFTPTSR
jgi:hypothetical protein